MINCQLGGFLFLLQAAIRILRCSTGCATANCPPLLPVAHDNHAFGVLRHVPSSVTIDDGDALVVEFLEHTHDSMLVRLSRLPVGSSASKQRRLIGERTGDGHALLLSAGKLIWFVVGRGRRGRRFRAPATPARAGLRLPNAAGCRALAVRHFLKADGAKAD